MIRGTLLVFVLGWGLWFWLDKNPMLLGPLPYPHEGEFLYNFQVGIDLLKQARFKAAFVYIWKAHYLVLSLAGGLLLGMLAGSLVRARARQRFISLYLPAKNKTAAAADTQTDHQATAKENEHERE